MRISRVHSCHDMASSCGRQTFAEGLALAGAHLGVVHGLAQDAGAEGGNIEDGAQGHTATVLKPGDALERYFLGDDVDVREAPLLLNDQESSSGVV